MDWYYAEQGQQKGPVSASDLQELARQGTIQGQTLVWCQDMPDWKPFDTVTALGATKTTAPSANPQSQEHRCGECGQTFSENAMVKLGQVWICATCKPRFIQRLQEGATSAPSAAWRSGRDLVVAVDASLPERCVKCNATVGEDGRLTRKLYWHHPLIYLLLIINLLVFAIVALFVRKRATITLSLCREHRALRIRHITIAWVVSLLGLGMLMAGILSTTRNDQTLALLGIGLVVLLAGAIYGAIRGRILVPRRIDRDYARLRGACPAFLEAFPDWTQKGR